MCFEKKLLCDMLVNKSFSQHGRLEPAISLLWATSQSQVLLTHMSPISNLFSKPVLSAWGVITSHYRFRVITKTILAPYATSPFCLSIPLLHGQLASSQSHLTLCSIFQNCSCQSSVLAFSMLPSRRLPLWTIGCGSGSFILPALVKSSFQPVIDWCGHLLHCGYFSYFS